MFSVGLPTYLAYTSHVSFSLVLMHEHVYFCVSAVIVTEAAPFSWWVGGPMPGQVQLHWGGALPGGRQCACGTQGNCLDHHHYCNCDADYDQW